MKKAMLLVAIAALPASHAMALNIVLSNDDGLTSNLKALYDALKAAHHDVIVSVPCSGQSGRGSAIVMYSPANGNIVATNDAQISSDTTLPAGTLGCHNGAATTTDLTSAPLPTVGLFTKAGYTGGDFSYVHGTPVMAAMYGVDVLAQARWGKAPDLLISGPNEGQNVGKIVVSSGTIGNVQFAAGRGIPAIALSAGSDTTDNTSLANADSAVVAGLSMQLINALVAKANGGRVLPEGVALNVNFPSHAKLSASTPFAFSRIGTYDQYNLKFSTSSAGGFGIGAPTTPTAAQAHDEAVVYQTKVAVTAMQVGYDHRVSGQEMLRVRLRDLLGQ